MSESKDDRIKLARVEFLHAEREPGAGLGRQTNVLEGERWELYLDTWSSWVFVREHGGASKAWTIYSPASVRRVVAR